MHLHCEISGYSIIGSHILHNAVIRSHKTNHCPYAQSIKQLNISRYCKCEATGLCRSLNSLETVKPILWIIEAKIR
ncbi:hypothetical protein ACN47E_009619 [Coniothyrium glycines]